MALPSTSAFMTLLGAAAAAAIKGSANQRSAYGSIDPNRKLSCLSKSMASRADLPPQYISACHACSRSCRKPTIRRVVQNLGQGACYFSFSQDAKHLLE